MKDSLFTKKTKVEKSLDLMEKIVFLGDVHIPDHDERCLGVVFKFLEYFQPDFIYLIGDILDSYQFGKYLKKPSKMFSFEKEIRLGKIFVGNLREICPKAKISWLDGNHEARLYRLLLENPAFHVFEDRVNIAETLGLPKHNISYHKYGEILQHGENFLIEHGNIVRNKSSYTAEAMLSKRLKSGISGHTHRLGVSHFSAHDTTISWYENGCLCNLNPEYVQGNPNWQHGFHVADYDRKTDTMWMQPIHIKDYKFQFEGWTFKSC